MAYIRTRLEQSIAIHKLITMYYFEFSKNYSFRGEQHDFWEILYVDKGEVEVIADTTVHRLRQGDIIFHKPNEFHSFVAYHGTAPNLIVMTFDCRSRAMKLFERKVLALHDEERNVLAHIIREGMNAFRFPFRHPLQRKEEQPFGSEQLIKILLETLLIRLARGIVGQRSLETPPTLSTPAKEKTDEAIAADIIQYLELKLDSQLTMEELAAHFHLSKTRLKEAFKRKMGTGIMEHFAAMKIEQAKQSIRRDTLNFTEISQRLGFSSVHYFSRAFKRETGMSPSEYARSVKARS
ncbi:AraC family transcriptional regulator [Paenibacillus cymbidii]|uniref:AraC family transcriptional regulator n=1 Tax=Paenibacillus cymbidii TaxID=1639034 RepID=UPI001081BC09|nr:helix-turn-helix domain-containing protein [Paenibacillus cymbidii]